MSEVQQSALDEIATERDLLNDLDHWRVKFSVTEAGMLRTTPDLDPSHPLFDRVMRHRAYLRGIASARQAAQAINAICERLDALEARLGPTKDEVARERTIAKSLRFDVLRRDDFKCTYCGTKGDRGSLRVDHVVPVSKGGKSTMANLTTACEPCNAGKSDKSVEAVPIVAEPPKPARPAQPRRDVGPPISKEEVDRGVAEIMAMLTTKGDGR
jgi:hypothetical protein